LNNTVAHPDQPDRTRQLAGLSSALIGRVGTDAERPGDLDRLIEVQRELVHQPDLADAVDDLGDSWALLADFLSQRWERDRAAHPDDADEAVAAAETALSLTPLDHPRRPDTLQSLGDLQARTDQLADAEKTYTSALALYQQAHNLLGEANTRQSLGRLLSISGEHDKADAEFDAALDIFQSIEDWYSVAATLAYRGRHRIANRRPDGFADWRRALDLAATINSYLFGQVVAIALADTRRMLLSGKADDFLMQALPKLFEAGGQAHTVPNEHEAALALTLTGFGVIRDLAAIKVAGPPETAVRSRLTGTAREFDDETGSQFGLAAVATEILLQVDAIASDNPLAAQAAAWIQTPTWDGSETFLIEHAELLSDAGHATMRALVEANPADDILVVHVNLLSTARRVGVAAAYAQLQNELAAERLTAVIRGWLTCEPDWSASAAYYAEHAEDLSSPAAKGIMYDMCRQEPGDARLWLHLGLVLLGDHQPDSYASIFAGEPDPRQRGSSLLANGDLDQALAWSSLARAHDRGRGALLMAQVRLARQESEQAAEALADAATHVNEEQIPNVLAAYDVLLEAQPDKPWRHAEHADALERAGRRADALNAYDRALRLDPDNPSLHFNKGQLLFNLGRFDEAIPELQEVTRTRPDDVLGARVLLGAIAWPAKQEEAREHFTAAISSPGALLTPWSRAQFRAIALAGLGRQGDAERELEASLPARSMDETGLDDGDKQLLQRFQNPPLPGLDALRRLLESAVLPP
jgi:tetratricopeptide (TPR) repeat protein